MFNSQSWLLTSSVEGVARMAAVGLGLDESAFTDAGRYGWVLCSRL